MGHLKIIRFLRGSLPIVLSVAMLIAQPGFRIPSVEAEASGLTLSVIGDDTSVIAHDTSTSNGLVPTSGGAVTYQWGWSDPGGSSAVFSQVLPSGMVWADESVTSGCTRTGTLSSGQTLTCTITGLTGIGSTNKVAKVYGLANGVSVTSYFTSGSQSSNPVSLTVAATPAVSVALLNGALSYQDALDPDSPGTTHGLTIPYTFAFSVPRTTGEGAKGVEPLQSPFSFSATIPAGSKLYGCTTDTTIRAFTFPIASSAASSAANIVPNSGAVSCLQTGTTVTFTLTGADTTFQRFPTLVYGSSTPLAANSPGYFAVAGFYLWKPLTDFTVGVTGHVIASMNSFTATGLSGQTAPESGASFDWPITLSSPVLLPNNQAQGDILIGQSAGLSGGAYPGANYVSSMYLSVPAGSGASHTNTTVCTVWDPQRGGLQAIPNPWTATGAGFTVAPTSSDFQVEYGTKTYANETARKAADCGSVGDGDPEWYASATAAAASPGGLASVTAVRAKFLGSLAPGQALSEGVLMRAPTDPSLPVKTKLPFYVNFVSDQTTLVRSTFTSLSGTLSPDIGYLGSGGSGNQITLSTAQVRNTLNVTAVEMKPGTSSAASIQPVISNPIATDGRNAVNTKVTTTLPDGCFAFVAGTTAPLSVTPPTPATPGVGQNCRNMPGQVIVWNLGDVPTTPAVTESPINFTLNLDPSTPTPYTASFTSIITSDSDLINVSNRTSTDTLTVSSVSDFSLTQTASRADATLNVPITYRVGWNNGLTNDIGQAWVVQVLPYNGDGRGTSGLGSLGVNSVATSPTGLAVEYTTASSTGLVSALTGDATGNTGIVWTSVKPGSGVTGIRVRTQSLGSNQSGYADVTVTPLSLAMGGSMATSLYGKADTISGSALSVSPLSLASTSSLITGKAVSDTDHSGTVTGNDIALQGATVTLSGYSFGPNGTDNGGIGDDMVLSGLTATSDSSGAYQFLVAAGRYRVTVIKTGYDPIATHESPFLVASSVAVTGKNFLAPSALPTPVLAEDSVTVASGKSTSLSPLANDPNLGDLPAYDLLSTITSVSQPTYGKAILTTPYDGTILYTAASIWPQSVPGLSYTETFTYTVTNAQGASSVAVISVLVTRLASIPSVSKPGKSVDVSTGTTGSSDESVIDTPVSDTVPVSSPTPSPADQPSGIASTPVPSVVSQDTAVDSSPQSSSQAFKSWVRKYGAYLSGGILVLLLFFFFLLAKKRRRKEEDSIS